LAPHRGEPVPLGRKARNSPGEEGASGKEFLRPINRAGTSGRLFVAVVPSGYINCTPGQKRHDRFWRPVPDMAAGAQSSIQNNSGPPKDQPIGL